MNALFQGLRNCKDLSKLITSDIDYNPAEIAERKKGLKPIMENKLKTLSENTNTELITWKNNKTKEKMEKVEKIDKDPNLPYDEEKQIERIQCLSRIEELKDDKSDIVLAEKKIKK